MSILIEHLNKRFGQTVVCDDISLEILSGSLVALLGPSGSGKTSLLRIIAGLEVPDSGRVLFHGEDTTHADPQARGVGFVFQHYALFNHMTIFENVAFGLRVMPHSHISASFLRSLVIFTARVLSSIKFSSCQHLSIILSRFDTAQIGRAHV